MPSESAFNFNFNPDLSKSKNSDKDPNQQLNMSQYGQMAVAADADHNAWATRRYALLSQAKHASMKSVLSAFVDLGTWATVGFIGSYVIGKIIKGKLL